MRSRIAAASDARGRVAMFLLLSALLSGTVHAQAPSEAATIIESFGTSGTLRLAGLTAYLSSVEFRKLDLDKSGSLDADEYVTAQLYARLPGCGTEAARETWLTESAQGDVDSERLRSGNPMWKTHVNEMAQTHWSRASADGQPLDEAGVAAYLTKERMRRERVPTAAERLNALSAGQQADITITQFDTFFTSEWFAKVDTDGSGTLTFVEFTRASKYLTAATEFCALAGDDGLVARADIADPVKMEADAPALQIQLIRSAIRLRQAVSPLPRVPVQTVRMVFEQEEKAMADRGVLAALSRRGFVPGHGLLLWGTRRLSESDEISWNQNEPAGFLRVIKDFSVDDPLKAEPALFTVAGEQGKETTFAIDSTFQLDFYPASFQLLRAAVGVDVERQTGSSGSNVRSLFTVPRTCSSGTPGGSSRATSGSPLTSRTTAPRR